LSPVARGSPTDPSKSTVNPPETCPHCGAVVPRDAAACPECGADEQTGWSERASSQRLDLPDDEFNYEEFVRHEFATPSEPRIRAPGVSWLWWGVAVLLAGAFLLMYLRF
jgi:hypothetical protein